MCIMQSVCAFVVAIYLIAGLHRAMLDYILVRVELIFEQVFRNESEVSVPFLWPRSRNGGL